MKNCTKCADFSCKDEKCHNRNSQYYDDYVNEYSICVLWIGSEEEDEHTGQDFVHSIEER